MKKLKPPVTAWSYSRWDVYNTCAQQFKFKHIDKYPEPEGPALARGNTIHKGLEQFVDGRKRTVPSIVASTLGPLAAKIKELKKAKALTELELCVDSKWQPTAWFSPTAWFRAKVDVLCLRPGGAYVGDYKSGKMRADKHMLQLETYAPIVYAHYPETASIESEMLYVDHGTTLLSLIENPHKEVPRLKQKWEKAVAPMFKDVRFKPNPGMACNWCAFSQRRGGPCKAG